MVRSLALVLAVVGVVALITVRGSTEPVRSVSYGTELAAARSAAPYDVVAPVGLDDFRATSVRYRVVDGATVWHLGFLTPAGAYAGVDQTDVPAPTYLDDFVAELTEGGVAAGETAIDGDTWQRYDGGGSSSDEQVRGLLRSDDDVSVLVSGTAEWVELEALAAALDAGSGGPGT